MCLVRKEVVRESLCQMQVDNAVIMCYNSKCKKESWKMYGYVYVVEFDGHYKIGSSINPQRRAQEVARFYKEPNLVIGERVPNFREIELVVHKMFETKRERGEWFRLDADDLVTIKRFLESKKGDDDKPEESVENKLWISGDYEPIFTNEQFLIDKYRSKPSVYLAYCKMKKYLVPNYNVLLKNGKRYKVADLAEDLQVSRQMASLYVRDLKNDNVICEIETHNKGFLFAINPWYACNGEKCDELVVKAFEKQAEELAEKNKKQDS